MPQPNKEQGTEPQVSWHSTRTQLQLLPSCLTVSPATDHQPAHMAGLLMTCFHKKCAGMAHMYHRWDGSWLCVLHVGCSAVLCCGVPAGGSVAGCTAEKQSVPSTPAICSSTPAKVCAGKPQAHSISTAAVTCGAAGALWQLCAGMTCPAAHPVNPLAAVCRHNMPSCCSCDSPH
jgi:hypothetical protein